MAEETIKDTIYFKQAKLLLRVLPLVMAEDSFALKGGTAINFFIRDLPRLSVDIDLTYLPIESRDVSLTKIAQALKRITNRIESSIPQTRVFKQYLKKSDQLIKLFVRDNTCQITIEPNLIIRGAVYPCKSRDLSSSAEKLFELSVNARMLSFADLFGGKFCAALDRQHPRDIYDVKILMENEGITDEVRKAFVVYLVSHNRPMNEILNPNWKDIRTVYENEFIGMVIEPIEYDELIEARERLIVTVINNMTDKEKAFLISMKEGQPKWELMEIEGIEKLPAIQWKLKNIDRMDKQKQLEALNKLKARLNL